MNDWSDKNRFFNTPRKMRVTITKTPADEHGRTCHMHKEGEVFEFDFERCPANICAAAWHSIWPMIRVVELGGRHPWDRQPGVTNACCPDPFKPVIFRIEALPDSPADSQADSQTKAPSGD